MIVPEWDKDTVTVTEGLPARFPAEFRAIKNCVGADRVFQLRHCKDIWCRDFMPIQVTPKRGQAAFVGFRYEPSYLREFEALRTNPADVDRSGRRLPEIRRVDFRMDGGHLVSSGSWTIITQQVARENRRTISNVAEELAGLLDTRIITVPAEPSDWTGHADGMLRFVSETSVVVNDYFRKPRFHGLAFPKQLRSALERNGIQIAATLPYAPGRSTLGAGRNYVNYLQLRGIVLVPSYGHPDDDVALRTLTSLFPTARIQSAPAASLAREGGVWNCVTWTTKERS